jgi:regulation of enolase protein 1 (concanavalin A-like superfamily)
VIAALLIITAAPWAAGGPTPFKLVVVDEDNPRNPHNKAVGDIDGDGYTDLIVGSASGDGLFWYRYPDWQKFKVADGSFTTDMQAADVDGDGDVDLVIPSADGIAWYENPLPEGEPTAANWKRTVIGAEGADNHDVEVADVNADGRVDVVTRRKDGHGTFVWLQVSPGQWTKVVVSTRHGEGTALGDLDGDGDLDIAQNGFWLENADGTGTQWIERHIASNWPGFVGVLIADVDGDGRQDIVAGPSEDPNGRLAWYSAADPRTGPWNEHVIDPHVSYLHTFKSVDMDGDGDLDLVTAEMHQSSDPDEVSVYYNEDGQGGSWSQQVIGTAGSHNIRVADIGGDGDYDVFGANWNDEASDSAVISLWENQTRTRLPNDRWRRLVIDDAKPWTSLFVDSADVDGDGHRDILTGGWWYRNPGLASGVWNRHTLGSPLNNLATVFDADGDGDPDVLGTKGLGSQRNSELAWARNDGAGEFTVSDEIEAQVDADFLQGAVPLEKPGGGSRVALSWHESGHGVQAVDVPDEPSAQAWPWKRLSTVSQDEDLSAGDIDRDGDPDLLLGTKWLRNDGDDWTPFTLFESAEEPDRNELADIDGDGRLDAVVGFEVSSPPGKLAWYRQPADPTRPWEEQVIAHVTNPLSVGATDMDGDGDVDVVVGEHDLANPADSHLYLFENRDAGMHWVRHTIGVGDEHHDGAHLVDIDGDGDTDVVSIGWTHQRVLLYENLANEPEQGDTSPPEIDGVQAGGERTRVVVRFSEVVEAESAERVANYAVDGGVDVVGASLAGDGRSVVLETSVLEAGVSYTLSVGGVRDLAGNVMVGSQASFVWSEMPVDGLRAWFRADQGVSGSGVGVQRWADQSGGGVDAVQASEGRRPVVVEDAVGGRPAVMFDGADDFLTFPLGLNGWSQMTMVVVSAASDLAMTGSWNGAERAPLFWNETAWWGAVHLSPFDAHVRYRFGTEEPNNLPGFARPQALGGRFSVTMARKDAGHESLFVDGQLAMEQSGRRAALSGIHPVGNLGRGFNDNTFFRGKIAEVFVYDRAIGATERAQLEQYLQDKYFAGAEPPPPGDSSPPSVALSAPADGATVAGDVRVAADATDDDAVAGVQFRLDGQDLGAEDTEAPFEIEWPSHTVADGQHTLSARARDRAGNTATATPITVTVQNDTTPPQITELEASPSAISALITWKTDKPARSRVAYGPDSRYGWWEASSANVRDHSIELHDLACDTTYHFQARSTDASGNQVRSDDMTLQTGACPHGLISDEFNSPVLDTTRWSFLDPVGDSTLSMSGSAATITMPAGSNHDLWAGASRAPRLLQAAPDGDFEVEVKFDSAVAEQYQLQGIVVQQSADQLLRFEVHHDGAGTRLFAAAVNGGDASVKHHSTVAGGAPAYLRLKRSGDVWTLSHSTDGQHWTAAPEFVHRLTMTAIGPFAGNTGGFPPGFSGAIDHFRVIPADREAPQISAVEVAPRTVTAEVSWSTDEPATSEAVYGRDEDYGSSVSRSALVRDHTLTLRGLSCETTYRFQTRSADASGNRRASDPDTFTTGPCPGELRSDEFGAGALDPGVWTFVDPIGDAAASLAAGRLAIAVPEGVQHDLWTNANHAPRVVQAAPDTDFHVEAKFDSATLQRFQMQGIVVEQDADDLLRFELHHDGGATRLFAAVIEGGVGSTKHLATVAGAAPTYLRVRRAGNLWRLRYSDDGEEWTSTASFRHDLRVSAVGPFAGNGGGWPPAFTVHVDHFRVIGPDVTPPVVSGVDVTPGAVTARVRWTTDEPAAPEVVYGPDTGYGTSESKEDLVRNHSLLLRGLTCGRTYHFQVRAQDEEGNEGRSDDRTFQTTACPAALRSDEFDQGSLDTSLWTFVDPVGDAAASVAGGRAAISVTGGTSHELWTNANRAPRLLQAAPDDDFEVELKFDSAVQSAYQMQGIVVEQDVRNLLRLEVHHNGEATRMFVAALENGVAETKYNVKVPGGAPTYLWLGRAGNRWTLRYSNDGEQWSPQASFTHPLKVAAVGPFAGNSGGSPPEFSALVDHFRVVPPPPPDVTPPAISGVLASPSVYMARVRWTTDELSTSKVEFGTTTAYERDSVKSTDPTASHGLRLERLDCETTYHYRVTSTDEAGNASTSGDRTFTTGECPQSGGPHIDVWYGQEQTFGHLGRPLRWINLLGTVSDADGIAFLDYSLNGGPRRQVTISDGNLRIAHSGDFNLELDPADLDPGANTVEFISHDRPGHESRKSVTLNLVQGVTASLPFTAAWSEAQKIADVAQVTDGLWTIQDGAVRTVDPGYDRLIVLGEMTWTDYEVTAPITIHSLSSTAPHAGVGLITGWQGHEGSTNPRLDWPLGGLCFYFRNGISDPYRLWMMQFSWPHYLANEGNENHLEPDVPYIWKFRTQTVAHDPSKSRYSCKVWRDGASEPAGWGVEVEIPTRPGSVALVADYADVSFGDVAVRPLMP